MANWLVTAQQDNNIPDPTQADQPDTESVKEKFMNDPELQSMYEWFSQVKEANEFLPKAKDIFEEKLKSVGIQDPSLLPPEVTSLFQ